MKFLKSALILLTSTSALSSSSVDALPASKYLRVDRALENTTEIKQPSAQGSGAPCGTVQVWLEYPITNTVLQTALENINSLNPSSLVIVTYCSLWSQNKYGIDSADIQSILTRDGALPVTFLTRLDNEPGCVMPNDAIVTGSAMDSEDSGEVSTPSNAATLACASEPNTWGPGHWYRCCPNQPSGPLPVNTQAACATPLNEFIAEFYDFGMKPYTKMSYVQNYFNNHFNSNFARSFVPMFRPESNGANLHDGWNATDSASWRAQDPTCTAYQKVGLYVSAGN